MKIVDFAFQGGIFETLEDSNEDSLEEYTKDLEELFTSSDIVKISTDKKVIAIRPSKLIFVSVRDEQKELKEDTLYDGE